jgi:hypothetical protein
MRIVGPTVLPLVMTCLFVACGMGVPEQQANTGKGDNMFSSVETDDSARCIPADSLCLPTDDVLGDSYSFVYHQTDYLNCSAGLSPEMTYDDCVRTRASFAAACSDELHPWNYQCETQPEPEPEPTCGPDTCAGCCAGNVCMAGLTTGSCGTYGMQCLSCQEGFICNGQAGLCVVQP